MAWESPEVTSIGTFCKSATGIQLQTDIQRLLCTLLRLPIGCIYVAYLRWLGAFIVFLTLTYIVSCFNRHSFDQGLIYYTIPLG
jgi:hypothetical protein